ncbi:Flp family type IVb pilin [Pacificimonas sp. ICDLI1SI03]|jgi:pilus assembly protein Flp/PilA|tara:strand:- start:138914 stop:139090 length:177 start_codon:yes stop_codon:yes gene_type:complete
MRRVLRRLTGDDSGATAIEYGLLAALICIAAIAGFNSFGEGLFNMWGRVSTETTSRMG